MKFICFLQALFQKEEFDRRLSEEVTFHLEKQIEQNMEAGMSPEEARHAALRSFGGVEQVKEECRDARGVRFVERLLQDFRFALRMLAKNPGFTGVAIITLALGIGLNTAVFSMVNGLLLRPLPIQHPSQIYTLAAEEKSGGFSNGFSYGDFQEIRNQTSGLFSDMAGVQVFSATGLTVDGKSERIWTNFVTGNFFSLLGIRPALGRFILPSEGDLASADPVLVLGYSFWQAHLGGDPNIVGKRATVNGRPVTIIGVAPEGFRSISSIAGHARLHALRDGTPLTARARR